jgi:hypothetical protein
MDLLELVESIQSETASVQRIYSGDGASVRSSSKRNDPRYMQALTETALLIAGVKSGKRAPYLLQEAMTTSDFPILFGDIVDRVMLQRYQRIPEDWALYARGTTVRDFRPQEIWKRWALGGETILEEVKEREEYPERSVEEQPVVTWRVKKYGARMSVSWEMIINDDQGYFDDLPERLAESARRTETDLVVDVFTSTTGPNATLYNNTNGNLINTTNGASVNNPPLSIQGLQDALIVLSNMRDEEGQPIFIDMTTLVVPPALEVTARNILNAIQIELTRDGGIRDSGTGEERLIVNNWMKNRVQLAVNPFLPIRSTTNGNTSWYLFAAPSAGRGAIWLGRLRGHEAPELFVKEPNARRVGGGQVNPLDGDFDTDSIDYKVRLVRGVTTVDPKLTVASNGTGV